jgi:hypothetical protein
MKLKSVFLAFFFRLSVAALFAQDAVKNSPEHYKVTFENEKVRVLEYSAKPSGATCGIGKHSHPAHLVILLTDQTVKITQPDGTVTTESGKAGETFWSAAETHEVENVGATDARCYVIELKDENWKPSTGMAASTTNAR